MEEFIWKDAFSIGVDEIDNQHKMLLSYVNECMKKAESGSFHTDVQTLIEKLKSYVATHFADEEKLMEAVFFPDLEKHRVQHRLLTEQIGVLERAAASGERQATLALTSLLRDWYLDHIMVHDQRIGAHLHRKK